MFLLYPLISYLETRRICSQWKWFEVVASHKHRPVILTSKSRDKYRKVTGQIATGSYRLIDRVVVEVIDRRIEI